MRKFVRLLIIVLLLVACSQSFERRDIQIKCVDGDTIWINDEKIRFLAIDAPEMSPSQEPYAQEATDFVCKELKQAEKIHLKYDLGNTEDRYGRSLYWIYVDDELLQELLLKEGLAKIKYVDYETVDKINLAKMKNAQRHAQKNKKGIWKNQSTSNLSSALLLRLGYS